MSPHRLQDPRPSTSRQARPHSSQAPIPFKMPPKAAKGEYIETVCATYPFNSTQFPIHLHQSAKTTHSRAVGHGEQDLAPISNPWHTAHHPRRENSHPSRSRHPRRPLPTPLNCRLHRPRRPTAATQRAQRCHHRRPIQLHLQMRDPAPSEPVAPWCALLLPAQDR